MSQSIATTKVTKHLDIQERDMEFHAPDGTWWIVESLGSQFSLQHWGVEGGVPVNSDNDEIFEDLTDLAIEMKAISGDLRKWHVTNVLFEDTGPLVCEDHNGAETYAGWLVEQGEEE